MQYSTSITLTYLVISAILTWLYKFTHQLTNLSQYRDSLMLGYKEGNNTYANQDTCCGKSR